MRDCGQCKASESCYPNSPPLLHLIGANFSFVIHAHVRFQCAHVFSHLLINFQFAKFSTVLLTLHVSRLPFLSILASWVECMVYQASTSLCCLLQPSQLSSNLQVCQSNNILTCLQAFRLAVLSIWQQSVLYTTHILTWPLFCEMYANTKCKQTSQAA